MLMIENERRPALDLPRDLEEAGEHAHVGARASCTFYARNATTDEDEVTPASAGTGRRRWETVTMQVSLIAAVIAGSVGLASAVLSTVVAVLTIRRANKQDFDTRAQQIALALLPRRLDALERIWAELFQIEMNGSARPAAIDELIPATLWLGRPLRDRFVTLLLKDAPSPQDIRELRKELTEASAVTTIDRSISRISSGGPE